MAAVRGLRSTRLSRIFLASYRSRKNSRSIISTASWTVGEIFTEVFEPEGEVGALTRAVLAYRDAFLRDVGLNDDDAPVESYEPFRRMVALAEAIAPSSPPQG